MPCCGCDQLECPLTRCSKLDIYHIGQCSYLLENKEAVFISRSSADLNIVSFLLMSVRFYGYVSCYKNLVLLKQVLLIFITIIKPLNIFPITSSSMNTQNTSKQIDTSYMHMLNLEKFRLVLSTPLSKMPTFLLNHLVKSNFVTFLASWAFTIRAVNEPNV